MRQAVRREIGRLFKTVTWLDDHAWKLLKRAREQRDVVEQLVSDEAVGAVGEGVHSDLKEVVDHLQNAYKELSAARHLLYRMGEWLGVNDE